MPGKRLSMRKIKEVLRLRFEVGLSQHQIAHSCGMGRTTVREYLQRAGRARLSWPLPETMTDGELETLLFAPPLAMPGAARPLPDWQQVHEGSPVGAFPHISQDNRKPTCPCCASLTPPSAGGSRPW